MPRDRTVIYVPPLKNTQFALNVSENVMDTTYNEGIYITDDSLTKTYPKSVVRIYKNPNLPKKIYLVSKDSSNLDAVLRIASPALVDATTSFDAVKLSTAITPYLSLNYLDLQKYSNFKQPSNITNLNFEDNSLIGKSLNLYTLSLTTLYKIGNIVNNETAFLGESCCYVFPTRSVDGTFNSGIGPTRRFRREFDINLGAESNLVLRGGPSEGILEERLNSLGSNTVGSVLAEDSTIESINNEGITSLISQSELLDTSIEGSYLLRGKSLIAQSYNDRNECPESCPTVFNQIIYDNSDYKIKNKIGSLTELDLAFWKKLKITKTKSINFSDYLEQKHENVWVQKVDSNNLPNTWASLDEDFYSHFTKKSYIISQKLFDSNNDSFGLSYKWYPLYSSDPQNIDALSNNLNNYNNKQFNDNYESLSSLKDKFLFFRKTKAISNDKQNTIFERQLNKIPDETLKEFIFFNDSYALSRGSAGITIYNNSPESAEGKAYRYSYNQMKDYYLVKGGLTHSPRTIFGVEQEIAFNTNQVYVDAYTKTNTEVQAIGDLIKYTEPGSTSAKYLDNLGFPNVYYEKESTDFYTNDSKARYLQEKSLDTERDLTDLYVFKKDFESEFYLFGFVPDDPESTIYELELEEELDIENGTFMVVEIE